MRSYDAVHLAAGYTCKHLFRLRVSEKARKGFDANWIAAETLGERIGMLRCKQGCWHEYCNLLAILNCLERCAHGHFGFPKANIATDQAVHWNIAFHVAFHQFDSYALVWRFNKGKCTFHFMLPRCVFTECMANRVHSSLVQHNKFLGNFANCRTYSLFCAREITSAKSVQCW